LVDEDGDTVIVMSVSQVKFLVNVYYSTLVKDSIIVEQEHIIATKDSINDQQSSKIDNKSNLLDNCNERLDIVSINNRRLQRSLDRANESNAKLKQVRNIWRWIAIILPSIAGGLGYYYGTK
jgi:hypothetical protein